MSGWKSSDSLANNMPKYLDTNYPGNTNVYLVNAHRMHNASSILANSVAHQGWVKVYPGQGSLETISFVAGSNVAGNQYATANLIITGANTHSAKANVVVSGSTFTVNILDKGAGYTSNTTIVADNSVQANNSDLKFSFSGGRIGRNLSEVMVALSSPNVTNANSGGKYFPGT